MPVVLWHQFSRIGGEHLTIVLDPYPALGIVLCLRVVLGQRAQFLPGMMGAGIDLGFDKVVSKYAKGDKAPAAALKKGYSLLEIKNNEAGVRELRQLIQKYPNSDSAQLAKDRLTAMGISPVERSAATTRRSR